jgi:ubiquinone/menaquinone biosynthesis C-methylase UbiE
VAREPVDFEESYATTPPWDIGRPQPPFAALMDAGRIGGRVLDVGCGTGEHALMAAAAGLDATGVDIAPTAIRLAEAKARDRGLTARFVVGDAFALEALGGQFDTVLDCGLFHVFDDDDRPRLVASPGRAVAPGGRYWMLCFSEHEPGDWGPRRVTQAEIRAAFGHGWDVESIEEAELHITLRPEPVQAWLAALVRR